MPSLIARLLLFMSSYFPLACILAVLFFEQRRTLAIVILGIGLAGLLGMFAFLRYLQRFEPSVARIEGVERRDTEITSYLVTYVIPFLALPSDNLDRGVALLIFFAVLCLLYVNSNMIHINPMMTLCRYHLYEVTLANGDVCAVLSRLRLTRGQQVRVVRIGEDILLVEK
jgi:hypothetical protein